MFPYLAHRALPALAILTALGLAAGCDATTGEDTSAQAGAATSLRNVQALDVNDVSILFANDAKGQPFPNLPVDDALWPQAIFDQVTGYTPKASIQLHPEAKDRKQWRVVGVRFDPCVRVPDASGNLLPAPASLKGLAAGGQACNLMQIRFSVQPMMGNQTIDTAAHLVFDIAKTEAPATLVQRLLDIKKASKVATTGQPLGVHPGLVGAKDANLAQAITDAVKATLATATLEKVTFMGLGAPNEGRPDGAPWTFFGGPVTNGAWGVAAPVGFDVTHGKVLTFDAPAVTFTANTGAGILVGSESMDAVLPKLGLTSADVATTQSLVNASDPDDPDSAGGPPATDEAKARALFIDNPLKNDSFRSDCTSCHTTTPSIHRLSITDGADRFAIPKGVTGFASIAARQDGPDNYVVRSFGYMPSIPVADGGDGKNHPIVSNRVANESALVADLMNRQVLGLAANGAKDCSAPAVWACFAATGKSDRECLAKCR